jgi:hypothetical protein
MHNPLLDNLIARFIPGSIQTHYLVDAAVAKEVARLIDERLPGTRRKIEVTRRLLLVTWIETPYDDVLKACFPFNLTGHFLWQGESIAHKPLFLRWRRSLEPDVGRDWRSETD